MTVSPSASDRHTDQIAAVVLAAGQSRRMGTPKLVLPWGSRTVISQVVQTLLDGGISEIVVVTGGAGEAVEAVLKDAPVKLVPNPEFAHSEMVASLQIGIRSLAPTCKVALIALGDQPTIDKEVVQKLADAYKKTGASIIIPSYQMRRGHPWLVVRSLWPDILALSENQTMRDFLRLHEDRISYIQVSTHGIFLDLDTPEDYDRLKPSI